MKSSLHSLGIFAVVGVALSFAPTLAPAATISWSSATTISGDSDVSTVGDRVGAYNFGGVNTTVNGVAFVGSSITAPSTTGATGNTSDNLVTLSTAVNGLKGNSGAFGNPVSPTDPTFSNLTSNYQTLLKSATYIDANSVGPLTVTLNELTIGDQYTVQVWINDSRGSSRTATLADAGGNTVLIHYAVPVDGQPLASGDVGQFALGTFTADATTQSFTITGSSSGDAQINALQLRKLAAAAIPEPVSAVLALPLGALALIRRR